MMFRKDHEEPEEQEDAVELVDDAEDIEMVREQASGLVGFFGGLVIGAVVGAGVALLVAPERGDVVRRRIREKLEHVSDDAIDRFEDLRDDAGRRYRRGKRRFRRVRNRVTD